VRCDLGSVDEPGDPPCLRCRREKKECIFSETRRKRKVDEDGTITDEYVARNKRATTSNGGFDGGLADDTGIEVSEVYDKVEGTNGFPETSEGLGADGSRKKGGNQDVKNETAAVLFGTPIIQPADALRMLVDAASRTENDDRATTRRDSEHESSRKRPIIANIQRAEANMPAIDPAIVEMGQQSAIIDSEPDPDVEGALQAWKTMRFVRAGWFTANEGMAYVSYFYQHLAPLTPVSPPDFSSPGTHLKLLSDEPVLTVTILTIASRHMPLSGAGGKSRSFIIHDKLWQYLQGMITRMFWGQEQFGGGFCGAGHARTAEEVEARRRGLRSLGTVESLLLLSDWHPRSMHFPPGDDGNDLIITQSGFEETIEPPIAPNAQVWTEPAMRSDRICWSLVGMAYTLAFELGVFDSLIEHGKWTMGPQAKTLYDPERADRLGRMLFVYVSQTCGRLGFPNMMPHQGTETDFDFLKMDVPAGTYIGPYDSVTTTDKVQRAWAELTALSRQSNTELFESKRRTHESIQNGDYMRFLERFGPKLRDWKERFEQTESKFTRTKSDTLLRNLVPPKARIMILIEYEYSRELDIQFQRLS
jgi:hypothetical protein